MRQNSSHPSPGASPGFSQDPCSHSGQPSPAQPSPKALGLPHRTWSSPHPWGPGHSYSQRSAQPRPRASRTLTLSCQQAEVSPWREISRRVPPAQLRAPPICAEASPEMLLADAARHSGAKQPLPITVPRAMVLGRSSQGMAVEFVGRPPFRDRIAQ